LNVCLFTGYLTEDPVLKNFNGVNCLQFELVVYDYRRTKTDEKTRIPTYLSFEAWDSGAETIAKLAKKGSKLTVSASAKNKSKGDSQIIFRVNKFDFACLDAQADYNNE
jgi:single-stranded DNA-binding protein